MSSSATRQYNLQRGTEKVVKFCKRAEFTLVSLNNGYQLRVENLVDFYPVNGRYCILQTGERGMWESINDLRDIMLKAIPGGSVVIHRRQEDAFVRTGTDPTTTNVIHNVKVVSLEHYQKWYRRLWRKLTCRTK